MTKKTDTNAKALRVNLDPTPYGTFAEVGGGQEVSRWFFHVGGAAGTIAKTISAYDMVISDALYGPVERYVSRERVTMMLDHEYALLSERLGKSRAAHTAFFVFANTVATRSHEGHNECHGWVGLRLQTEPLGPSSDILIHINLRDPTAIRQQQSLGVFGVNMLYATLYQRQSRTDMLASLMDGLSIEDLEVDVVVTDGPAFADFADSPSVAVDLLKCGLARAVVFDDHSQMNLASSDVHKRAMLLHRGSLARDNPQLDAMLNAGAALLQAEAPEMPHPPVRMLEISLDGVLAEELQNTAQVSARIAASIRPGHYLMVTRWPQTYQLTDYLRRYSSAELRYIVGLDMVVQMLRHHFYDRIDGGLLEGLGRLLAPNVRVYVFAMPADVFRQRLALYETPTQFCRFPDKPELTLDDVELALPGGRLLQYLRETGWLLQTSITQSPANT